MAVAQEGEAGSGALRLAGRSSKGIPTPPEAPPGACPALSPESPTRAPRGQRHRLRDGSPAPVGLSASRVELPLPMASEELRRGRPTAEALDCGIGWVLPGGPGSPSPDCGSRNKGCFSEPRSCPATPWPAWLPAREVASPCDCPCGRLGGGCPERSFPACSWLCRQASWAALPERHQARSLR